MDGFGAPVDQKLSALPLSQWKEGLCVCRKKKGGKKKARFLPDIYGTFFLIFGEPLALLPLLMALGTAWPFFPALSGLLFFLFGSPYCLIIQNVVLGALNIYTLVPSSSFFLSLSFVLKQNTSSINFIGIWLRGCEANKQTPKGNRPQR